MALAGLIGQAAQNRELSVALEALMIGWIVRILMIAASVVTGWFVAKDAPIFGVAQVMVALLLLTFIVAVLAFWPRRWTTALNRSWKQ
ncbi:hypothetical protein [Microvirga calopogonii]|uniref:hypothetical protein n=1 Tax=Microvirga calopogonii TaxID=2078013 RepID=UPI001FE07FC9|nr:hypothetical protein [Microvirga calopogonii]